MKADINKNLKEKEEEFSRFVKEKPPMKDDFKQTSLIGGKWNF